MSEEGFSDVNYKSICCEQIPELFLDKLVAKQHFGKFGKINRFILRPNRLSCTIEYENEADAERAVEEAGIFNGQEFPVHFAEREVGHVQNTEEWVDADVQSELEAMGAGVQNQLKPIKANLANKMFTAPVKRSAPQRLAPKAAVENVKKIDPTLRSELENMLRQPAFSAEERYRVLDARDKLIRLTSVKKTDFTKAESRKGTCPDMCPEKERLMRDFQRQVAVFEMKNSSMIGSISHRHAIKEYSRSSADQEVPLCHELRPANVLKMTMLYLMSRIMDQVDDSQVNVSDWFHFVWDRTRSIRKDITQQELCSLDAVELVEQCARFHIHCAARLVAEDPSVFDKKINAENLTKCLQTLKYLYHDLRLKNIPCPREAEFRGYIVLLNLGNSNFLWEVKQLPEHIQQSKEIKRGMAFYNVLQNNNYVRFFKMVREKETSYLSACILLGYFTRLRIRALEAIVKSHNWRKNSVFIPLKYFTKILGFEDEQSAAQFFQFHELICDNERGVLLAKPQPAVDYCMERALGLVESKRTGSVGECICGRALESPDIFENHQPHNSFDDNGLLRAEAWNAEDQLRGNAAKEKSLKIQTPNLPISTTVDTIFKVPQTSPHAATTKQIPQPTQKLPFKTATTGFSIFASTNSFKTSTAPSNSIFNTVTTNKNLSSGGNLFANSASVASTATTTSNIFGNIPKETTTAVESLFPKTVDSKLFEVPRNDNVFHYFRPTPSDFGATVAQPSNEEELKRQQDLEAQAKQREIAETQRQLELEKKRKAQLEEAERKRKANEKAAERRRHKIAAIEVDAKNLSHDLISSTVGEEISKIVFKELHAHESRETRIKQLCNELVNEYVSDEVNAVVRHEYSIHCRDRMLLEQYFNKWLSVTRKKIEKRKLLDTTPIWATTDTREQKAEELYHPSQMYNMCMIKRYRHGEACDFNKLLWHEGSEGSGSHSLIDICQMISKYVQLKFPISSIRQRQYFKLILTLPGEFDEIPGFGNLCSKWLQNVLKSQNNYSDSQGPFMCTFERNVGLCVQKVCGMPPVNETDECDHANGIVCFMTCADLSATRHRIHYLLEKSKNFRELSIAFVVYDNSEYDEQFLFKALDLNKLIDRRLLGGYKFYNFVSQKMESNFRVILEHALLYVIRHSFSQENSLVMEKTQNWLETCLGEEMWRRWHVSELHNPVFRKICTIIKHVIGLYNTALEHVHDMLNEHFEKEAEFPLELKKFVPNLDESNNIPLGLEYFPKDWKSTERKRALLDFLNRIKLPEIDQTNPPPMHDINNLKMWLLDYAGQCISHDENSTAAAYYAIKALIEQLTTDDMQLLDISDRMKFVSFLSVMKPIIFAHINEQLKVCDLPAEIIYRSEKLQCYLEKPWWLSYEPLKSVTVDYNAKSTYENEEKLTKFQDSIEKSQDVLKRAAQISQNFEQKIKSKKNILNDSSIINELNQTLHDLETTKISPISIPILKRKNSKKENKIQNDFKEEPHRKRIQTNDNVPKPMPFVEADDVIKGALSAIERANASLDTKIKLDYTISKLDLLEQSKN